MREKNYTERDGKIYALVSYTDTDGKRRQIWRKAESKSDAREIARQLKEQLRTGTESFEHNKTLDEYLDEWLISAKQKLCERTFEDYRGMLRLYIRPTLGKKQLTKIRPADVQGLINTLAQTLAPKTARFAHMILCSSLKQAKRLHLITQNPAEDLELPKMVRKEMKSLDPEQAQTFLEFAHKDKYGLVFELALITGMRPEEYLGLQWVDIDFTKRTLMVQRTVVWKRWDDCGWYFGETKTPQSRRTIPLPAYLMDELAQHKRKQGEQRLKAGPKWQNFNLVFTTERGTPVSSRNLQRRHFKPILKKAELPDIRLYDLRHSCATLLLAAGENPKVVSERLGHSSIVLTLDVYSHVLPTMQQAATDRLEAIVRRK